MSFSVINFDSVDLRGRWVDHLVTAALKVTLCEDYCSLELLTVVTEAQILCLIPILHLHALQFTKP